MDVDECLRKGLLKIVKKDINKIKSSITIADSKLEHSHNLFNNDFFGDMILSCYTSMFHAARALLYREGMQKKSHYAVYIYLNEKYSNKIPKHLLNIFHSYQLDRHKILYGLNKIEISEQEAKESIEYTEEFLIKIKELIKY